MATGSNTVAAVSTTKGVAGGYFYSAPSTATVPTDITTALPADFVNLGFISEDGVTENIETDSESMVDMNGDTVYTSSSSRTETITATLIEVKEAALKEIYGQDMVTSSNDLITVKHGSHTSPERIYVLELVLRDGRRWRQVAPAGQVTEVGELALAAGELAGREITITCNVDANGVSVYDYIEAVA